MALAIPLSGERDRFVSGTHAFQRLRKQRGKPTRSQRRKKSAESFTQSHLRQMEQSALVFGIMPAPTEPPAVLKPIVSLKARYVDPIFTDVRAQQMSEMTLEEEYISEEQRIANQSLNLATGLLGTTALCLVVYPPLVLVHVPLFAYMSIPFYQAAINDLKNRRVTATVVDATLGVASYGYTLVNPSFLLITGLGTWVYMFTNKVVVQTKDGTRKSLTGLMGNQPREVWVLRDGAEVSVPYESLERDDIVIVDAGQMIPIDGVVAEGNASVDQHMLTGESQPAEKGANDSVLAATIVQSGRLFVRVTKTGAETAAAQVGQSLLETADFTAGVQLRGREIADRAALPVLLASVAAFPFVGADYALAILNSGFGANMKLLGPLSVLNFLQLAAREGVLIKDGRALEQIRTIDTVVFDKTGTLTLEQPHVTELHVANGFDAETVLRYAAAAEHRQTHPIAKAILEYAQDVDLPNISDAAYEVGYGIKVKVDGKQVRVGSNRFMKMEGIDVSADIQTTGDQAQAKGHSMVFIAIDDQLAGAIELEPTIRPEAERIVNFLHERGLKTTIISGDNERPTRALAERLGIDDYFAETLPENKADLIAELQEAGKSVCFIGDGINDSIALKRANVSVSLRGASTIATDTAQIILMDETLNQIEQLFDVADRFERNMHGNLMTSVVPGAIVVAGALVRVINFSAGVGIFAVGLAAGVGNAMWPRLTMGRKEKEV